jgi:hypothetical protein
MAEPLDEAAIQVPWKNIPVSEPILPGDVSRQMRRERGYPVWNPAMISVVAGVLTTEAHRLLAVGAVKIDGAPAGTSFGYIKPGALIEIDGLGRYRLGPVDPVKD